ncbi:glycosyltransferase family 1 protein [Bacillus sp. JJ1566]|uniref:glycosyltransferase family 1 protein n=1 Tax=Bacillus sp. JJ1566 TaxID=3122961 RepID=UPI002FFFFC2D
MGGPIRVLHVVVNMNRGGAETLIMNLYRNIDRSKVQFDFLTCKEGVFDEEIRQMGGQVHRLPYLTEIGHFGYVNALNKFFKNHNYYKIVHSHMDKMSGFVLRAAKKANIPFRIAHSHNTHSEGGLLAKIYKEYSGGFIKTNASHFFACSSAAAGWLFGRRAKEAFVLKNGIEINKFLFSKADRERVRNEFNISQDILVIGHVGRFNHQKNHVFLIDVFAKYIQIQPKSVLVLVGDGALRSLIEDRVRELNLVNNVLFLGVRPDIHLIIQAFDLFAFPSLHEGLPVTLVEAQGAGLQCLISTEITKEVDLGLDLVQYLPLAQKDRWVEKIEEISNNKKPRSINHTAFVKKGYDIRKTASLIQNSYIKLGGERLEAANNLYPNF